MTNNDKVNNSENKITLDSIYNHQAKKSKRGFASMSKEKVSQIASAGGRARAMALGSEGFSKLGQEGGKKRAAQLGPTGYSKLGQEGGRKRAQQLGSQGYAKLGQAGGRKRANKQVKRDTTNISAEETQKGIKDKQPPE